MDWLSTAPDRASLLTMQPDDPKRREIIIKRATSADKTEDMRKRYLETGETKPQMPRRFCYLNYHFADKEEVKEYLSELIPDWEGSEDADVLRRTFRTLVHEKRVHGINKIVCIGIGTLVHDIDDDDLEEFELGFRVDVRCCLQHVAANFLAAVLREQSPNGPVRVYAVDYAYNLDDKEILNDMGIEVLPHEHGNYESYVRIDKDTLVMSIGTGGGIYQVICETTQPAAMIWTWFNASIPRNGEDLSVVRKVLREEYEVVDCPPLSVRDAEEAFAPLSESTLFVRAK
ncbi:Uu.00g114320.m01.CDS01 [Anthostomella pinea]|uniref:Uu.00g114320.m01.CDS01 n=1 Tax=Anthostomella pinea TaxID=933095 RepID=A0AAI8VFN8_9PEZI|nr:Uu.00g114320.m01.CDS01 [Anthostomella pinea]